MLHYSSRTILCCFCLELFSFGNDPCWHILSIVVVLPVPYSILLYGWLRNRLLVCPQTNLWWDCLNKIQLLFLDLCCLEKFSSPSWCCHRHQHGFIRAVTLVSFTDCYPLVYGCSLWSTKDCLISEIPWIFDCSDAYFWCLCSRFKETVYFISSGAFSGRWND